MSYLTCQNYLDTNMVSDCLRGKAAAHVRPDAIKVAIGSPESLAITRSAFSDALSPGFDRAGIVAVIRSIQRRMFYKSMTTLADHRTWQDVYHVPADDLTLYVRFQADVVTEFRVMAFKER